MSAQRVDIDAATGNDQVLTQSIPSVAIAGDTITVSLLDWADSRLASDVSVDATEHADVFSRVEVCEMDEATAYELNSLEDLLVRIQQTFSENHPDVVAANQRAEGIRRQVLEDCVEQLQ